MDRLRRIARWPLRCGAAIGRGIWRRPWLISMVLTFTVLGFVVKGQDEFCTLAESQHAQNIQTLGRTYAYILTLKEKDLTLTLNRVVIASIPQTEARAAHDDAPGICDTFTLGLPEPDPVAPARPPRVDRLYERFATSRVGQVRTR